MSQDAQTLMKWNPLRYPFLLIDQIIDRGCDDQGQPFLVALKNVTINEPQFSGLFPDRTIQPGTFLLESLAQTAGGLIDMIPEYREMGSSALRALDKIVLRQVVLPGDRLIIRAQLARRRGRILSSDVIATVEGLVAARGRFTIAVFPQ